MRAGVLCFPEDSKGLDLVGVRVVDTVFAQPLLCRSILPLRFWRISLLLAKCAPPYKLLYPEVKNE